MIKMMFSTATAFGAGLIPGAGAATSLLRFFTSGIGITVVAAALAFAAGYHMRAEKAELDDLRAQVLVLKTDGELAENARKLAERQSAGLAARLKANQGRLTALQADVARRAGTRKSCGLSEDDAAKLRDIQ